MKPFLGSITSLKIRRELPVTTAVAEGNPFFTAAEVAAFDEMFAEQQSEGDAMQNDPFKSIKGLNRLLKNLDGQGGLWKKAG